MSTTRLPRERRPAGRVTLAVLSPVLRYSYARDAYVLRGVGGRFGPVLVPEHRMPKATAGAGGNARSAER